MLFLPSQDSGVQRISGALLSEQKNKINMLTYSKVKILYSKYATTE